MLLALLPRKRPTSCKKPARVTKLALKKLARAAATATDEAVKIDLEQQAADLRLSAPSKEFSSELWLQFNRRYFGCFEDPLLVTAMLIDPGNRGLFTADFIADSQLKMLKDIFAQQLTKHVGTRTAPIAVATGHRTPATEAAGGGVSADVAQPAPKRVLGSVRGAKRVFQPTANAAPDVVSRAAAELARYWTELDVGETPTLQWWHKRRGVMPHLADLAFKVLPIPASSTSSKRIFSAAGLTATDRRGRLTSANLATTLFVRFNHPGAIASRAV
jgi:hypothetical protein